MSKIEELIERLCPNGVEYRKLGDICEIQRGKRLTKKLLSEHGKYPVYHGGLEPLGYFDSNNREADTTMIINVGASAGTVGYCDKKFWSSDGCFCLSHNEQFNAKFLYYFLKANENILISGVRYAGIPTLDSKSIINIKVPIVSLNVQQEIVRILDGFSNLIEILKSENNLRNKQYEYYKELLITKQPGEKKYLKDILTIKNGRDYKHLKDGNIPVYGSGGIMTYVDTFAYDKPSVLIPRKGSLNNLYYVDKPFWNVDTIFYTDINTTLVVPKFLYYSLQLQHLERLNSAGGVPSLTQTILNNVCISIPPLAEQERIVSILDKFDTLVNNQEIGLPAEISKVQKQYEYYRDKLLTFKQA